jgi:hypothetical protein
VIGWISRVSANNNINGVSADGGSGTGLIEMTVNASVASGGSQTGFSATSPATGGATPVINIFGSTAFGNGTGINAAGPKSNVLISGSTIFDNLTGLGATNGGNILSYGNNDVLQNSTDGSPTASVTPK